MKNRIKNSSQKGSLLIISLSLATGVIFALPHFYGIGKYGPNYSPLIRNPNLPQISEETYTYAPEVHSLLKGFWRGDPYIYENRATPSPYVSELASILPIALLSLISGSVANGFILSDLIFPALFFAVTYFFLRKLRYRISVSICASLSSLIIPFFSTLFPRLESFGTLLTGSSFSPLFFTRTPHPQISTLYLFITIFLAALTIETKSKKFLYLWSAFIGISLYSSFYISSTIVLSTILLLPFILKKFKTKALLKGLIITTLISLPFLINFLESRSLFNNSDFISRLSLPKHFLFPSQLRYIFFGLAFLLWKRDKLAHVIFMTILSASILIDFHQVILEYDVQADHWIYRILAPLTTLSIFLILEKLVNNKKFLLIFIAIIILAIGFFRQIDWINANKYQLAGSEPKRRILSQIIMETTKNDVIGTLSRDLNDEIAGNTGRWVYIASGDRSWISLNESERRICNLAVIHIERSQPTNITEAVNYALGLSALNSQKVDQTYQEVNDCVKKNDYQSNYKLDYLISEDSEGNLDLIKIYKQ